MVDFAAKLAELKAKRALENKNVIVNEKKEEVIVEDKTLSPIPSVDNIPLEVIKREISKEASPNIKSLAIGTTRTSEIDHLDFMSKLGELSDALLHQHPRMPVLLMLIHKQLRADPELVTTLSEEEIGGIVNALKVQTKTELTGTVLKASTAKSKKIKLDTSMF